MDFPVITLRNPPVLSFGFGCLSQFFSDYRQSAYKRLFVVTLPVFRRLLQPFLEELMLSGTAVLVHEGVSAEPTFAVFDDILAAARDYGADSVAGIGGGSVLDTAKLLAAQLCSTQKTRSLIGNGLLAGRKTFLACLPTTSGTGSEVSPNAIFVDERDHEKKGIISPYLVPDAAYIDPELTLGLPPAVTACTGIDAFSHCLEAFVNRQAHPVTDGIALEGMKLIFKNLKRACDNGQDREARAAVALGSLHGGMCLGPVNTTAVHALAYPLGSRFGMAHGLSNALLLSEVMWFNLPAATAKFAEMARAIGVPGGGSEEARARAGIEAVSGLVRSVGIPAGLSQAGIPAGALPEVAASALKVQRLLKNNVREVGLQDALDIYTKAF
jgi:alcohol dehydrogenase class IV